MLVKNVPQSASGAPGYSVHYGYDVGSSQLRARFGSASGQGVTNIYDSLGRMTSTTTNMGGHSRPISYQRCGRPPHPDHPSGRLFLHLRL